MAEQRRRPQPRRKHRFEVGARVEPVTEIPPGERYMPGKIISCVWTEYGPGYLIQVGEQHWLAVDDAVQRRLDA